MIQKIISEIFEDMTFIFNTHVYIMYMCVEVVSEIGRSFLQTLKIYSTHYKDKKNYMNVEMLFKL